MKPRDLVVVKESTQADVSAQVRVFRGRMWLGNIPHAWQWVALWNTGPALTNVSLVLDNLPAGATLTDPSGATFCAEPAASPFKTLPGPLGRYRLAFLQLHFVWALGAEPSYTHRVLAGPGTP